MLSTFFASLLIQCGVSVLVLVAFDIFYQRSRMLKKYAVTRSLGQVIEEYQKLLAKDWNIEPTPLPAAFYPTTKVIFLIGTCLLFMLVVIVFDNEPVALPWTIALIGIFIFCLIGFLRNLWMTFTVVVTETSMTLVPFVSIFGMRQAREYPYASIENMNVLFTAQKGMYGRFGVGLKFNIQGGGRWYAQILNNLETPSVRAMVSLLGSRLGQKLAVTYQEF